LWELRLLNLFELSSPGASFGMRFFNSCVSSRGCEIVKIGANDQKTQSFTQTGPAKSLASIAANIRSFRQSSTILAFRSFLLSLTGAGPSLGNLMNPHSLLNHFESTHYCQVV
jgi:hypothetical protein